MSSKLEIKEGDKFGNLTVLKEEEPYRLNGKFNTRRFLCKCDCGNITVTNLSRLKSGKTKSCGCLRKKRTKRQVISGVYAIVNSLNGDMYIGSSKDITGRFKQHMYFCNDYKGTKGSYNLKKATKIYGIEHFILQILECCNTDKLLVREKYWIDKLQPAYNVDTDPTNPSKYLDSSKRNAKELWKHRIPHPRTSETKTKISNMMKGKAPSLQCLLKAANARKKKVVLKRFNSEYKIFNSLSECAIYLGISVKHASMIKQNKSLFRKQYKICDYVEMDKTIE